MSKVIVLGSINMDIVANTARHPSPGETVPGKSLKYFPGGKGANQAVAAAQAGAQTLMCGALGDDFFTDRLKTFLNDSSVDTTYVVEKGSETGTALITVAADGENTIVVVPGANGLLSEEDTRKLPVNGGDVLVAQYEVPIETTQALFKSEKSRERELTRILNPAPAKETPTELLQNVDILVVNETELAQLSGTSVNSESSDNDLLKAMSVISDKGLNGAIVTTLGVRGLIASNNGKTIRLPGYKVGVVDTTGAGDCFVGCLAAELASGKAFEEALKFANAAAALSVQSVGAGPSMPARAAIEQLLSS
jgi:ribokinase